MDDNCYIEGESCGWRRCLLESPPRKSWLSVAVSVLGKGFCMGEKRKLKDIWYCVEDCGTFVHVQYVQVDGGRPSFIPAHILDMIYLWKDQRCSYSIYIVKISISSRALVGLVNEVLT